MRWHQRWPRRVRRGAALASGQAVSARDATDLETLNAASHGPGPGPGQILSRARRRRPAAAARPGARALRRADGHRRDYAAGDHD